MLNVLPNALVTKIHSDSLLNRTTEKRMFVLIFISLRFCSLANKETTSHCHKLTYEKDEITEKSKWNSPSIHLNDSKWSTNQIFRRMESNCQRKMCLTLIDIPYDVQKYWTMAKARSIPKNLYCLIDKTIGIQKREKTWIELKFIHMNWLNRNHHE